MAVVQGSTLYAGGVSKEVIYRIKNGIGFQWGSHMRTELLMDKKPRQLTKGFASERPLQANIKNPRDSDFTASTTTATFNGRQLSVTDLMTIMPYDVEQFKDTFPEYQPKGLNIDLVSNPEIQAAIFDLIMNSVHNHINELHSVGDTGSGTAALAYYNGLVTLILADADATQVGTPAVLSSANIIDSIFGLRDAIPPRLRSNPNLKIFCSYADGDLFDRAARDTQDAEVITGMQGVKSITQANGSNIPVIPIEGIPKNFVFATIASQSADSNLVQGVWVDKDMDTLRMYKSEEIDQIYKIALRISVGVQHATGDDIFYLNNV